MHCLPFLFILFHDADDGNDGFLYTALPPISSSLSSYCHATTFSVPILFFFQYDYD